MCLLLLPVNYFRAGYWFSLVGSDAGTLKRWFRALRFMPTYIHEHSELDATCSQTHRSLSTPVREVGQEEAGQRERRPCQASHPSAAPELLTA